MINTTISFNHKEMFFTVIVLVKSSITFIKIFNLNILIF